MIQVKQLPKVKDNNKQVIGQRIVNNTLTDVKLPLSNVFMGANNNIPVFTQYDDVKIGKVGNSTICEISLSDDNVQHIETLINERETNVSTTKTGIRTRVMIPSNNVELCEVSLGHYRNTISKIDGVDKLILSKRSYYDKTTGERREKDAPNTEYKTILMCLPETKDEAITLLKSIFKVNDKIKVKWF